MPVGLRELRVAPGTVVTPLARDFLRRLGVGIAFVSTSEAGDAGRWGFAIETVSGVLEAFRRSLMDGAEERREVATVHANLRRVEGGDRALFGISAAILRHKNGASDE